MEMLLQLSLCVATVVQLTSSQSSHGGANSCECSEVRSELAIAVLQIQRLENVTEQLLRDVAELKAGNGHNDTQGNLL